MQQAVAPPGDGARPHVAETTKLDDRDRGVPSAKCQGAARQRPTRCLEGRHAVKDDALSAALLRSRRVRFSACASHIRSAGTQIRSRHELPTARSALHRGNRPPEGAGCRKMPGTRGIPSAWHLPTPRTLDGAIATSSSKGATRSATSSGANGLASWTIDCARSCGAGLGTASRSVSSTSRVTSTGSGGEATETSTGSSTSTVMRRRDASINDYPIEPHERRLASE